MTLYVIQTDSEKGRSFQGVALGLITAPKVSPWETKDKFVRPIWSVWATSEGETGPFIANLRLGCVGKAQDNFIEFMKSFVGFSCIQQIVPNVGTLTTLYFSELFRVDPGFVDPVNIRFCLLPAQSWLDAQPSEGEDAFVSWVLQTGSAEQVEKTYTWRDRKDLTEDDLAALVPYANLFATYLDVRTRAPLIQDPLFYYQLLVACVANNLVEIPESPGTYDKTDKFLLGNGCKSRGLPDLGVAGALVMGATHTDFEALLIRETDRFLKAKK